MPGNFRNAAPIPLDWLPDQALGVATFLQEVIDSIWLVHGDAMDQIVAQRRRPASHLGLDHGEQRHA